MTLRNLERDWWNEMEQTKNELTKKWSKTNWTVSLGENETGFLFSWSFEKRKLEEKKWRTRFGKRDSIAKQKSLLQRAFN